MAFNLQRCLASAILLSVATLIFHTQLCTAQSAGGTPPRVSATAPTVIPTTEEASAAAVTAGNSIRSTITDTSSQLLALQWTLAPCYGIQLHYHTQDELFQPVRGTGNVTLGVQNSETREWGTFLLGIGELMHIPAGDMHYIMNNDTSCSPVTAVGAWPYTSKTTWFSESLSSLPAETVSMFYTASLPAATSPLPFVTDPACTSRCGAAAAATPAAAGGNSAGAASRNGTTSARTG